MAKENTRIIDEQNSLRAKRAIELNEKRRMRSKIFLVAQKLIFMGYFDTKEFMKKNKKLKDFLTETDFYNIENGGEDRIVSYKPTKRTIDFSKKENRDSFISEKHSLEEIGESGIIEFVTPEEIIELFDHTKLHYDFQVKDISLNPGNNPLLEQEIERLMSQMDTKILLPRQIDTKPRNKTLGLMTELLLDLIDGLDDIGILEKLINDENNRNKTINQLFPQDKKIESNKDKVREFAENYYLNLADGKVDFKDSVAMTVLLRNYVNRFLHEEEQQIKIWIRMNHKTSKEKFEEIIENELKPTLMPYIASGKINPNGKIIFSGVTFASVKEEVSRRISSGKTNTIWDSQRQMEKGVEAFLREKGFNPPQGISRQIVDEMCLCETETEALEKFKDKLLELMPAIEEKTLPSILRGIANKIPEIENAFEKEEPNGSLLKFVSIVAQERKSPGKYTIPSHLIGVQERINSFIDSLNDSPFIHFDNPELFMLEMMSISMKNKNMYTLKNTLTLTILEYQKRLNAIRDDEPNIHIEEEDGVVSGENGVIDIYLPMYMNTFGGHFSDDDFSLADKRTFQYLYNRVPNVIREAFDKHREKYAAYTPIRLTEDQVDHMRFLAEVLLKMEQTNKAPEDFEKDFPEEYMSFEIDNGTQKINTYKYLYDLKNPDSSLSEENKEKMKEDYKKVRYQILLGAGLDYYRNYYIKGTKKKAEVKNTGEEIIKAAELYMSCK